MIRLARNRVCPWKIPTRGAPARGAASFCRDRAGHRASSPGSSRWLAGDDFRRSAQPPTRTFILRQRRSWEQSRDPDGGTARFSLRDRCARDAPPPPIPTIICAISSVWCCSLRPARRVNRPEFGCGIKQLVFAPASDALAAATEQLVHGALIRWLDPVLSVEQVHVEANDATLEITVVYAAARYRRAARRGFPASDTSLSVS